MAGFLKRLELQGFKSFAQKTVLDFPARITAIVGPNGSGKSNVIDALRWVLGEREAKMLRGETLNNLIFAGTPKRPAVGFAKVALAFDNSRRLFPFEVNEVVLTRRIDRSGQSKFFWHNEEIRLKDLLPILARAKLGSRGLTMVGQGESDIFVKSSPEERRAMVEEILGLREFRLKKNQALRQLEASKINMEKIQVSLEELAPHVRMLKKQKNRWDKRNEITKNLEALENDYFAQIYNALNRELVELQKKKELLFNERKIKDIEVKELEEKISKIDKQGHDREKIKFFGEKINALFVRQAVLQEDLIRKETQIEFGVHRSDSKGSRNDFLNFLSSLADDLEKISLYEIDRIKPALDEIVKRLKAFIDHHKKTINEEAAAALKKIKEEMETIQKEIERLRTEQENFFLEEQRKNLEFRVELDSLQQAKGALREIEARLERQFFEEEKVNLKLSELEEEWRLAGRTGTFRHLPPPETVINPEEARRKILRLRGELMALGEIDEGLVKEAEESEKRYEFLKGELEDLKKAAADLKKLIKELDLKIEGDFKKAFHLINEEFNKYFRLMFDGGRARLKIIEAYTFPQKEIVEESSEITGKKEETAVPEDEREVRSGVEIELSLPRKKIKSLDVLSGGEKSLVSIAALFALISVSPPPFLVLDEIDATLDEENARRFAELVKEFSRHTQFIIVTHNRATMAAAEILYGITMGSDGVSKVLSLKLEERGVDT